MHMCMHFFLYREGHDRTDIGLPGKQDQLLQAIKGAITKTTPMIVMLMSGGSVDITTAKVKYMYINHWYSLYDFRLASTDQC